MFDKKPDALAKTTKEIKPDLIMTIHATQQQMDNFGIKIEGSKIIRKGKPGKVEGNAGTFSIPDVIFDFSKNIPEEPIYRQREANIGNIKVTYGAQNYSENDLYKFPNAVNITLSYLTPKEKPRPQVPGEYRASDYFELLIQKEGGSSETFYLEPNLEVRSN